MKKIFIRSLPYILLFIACVWAGKGLFKYNVFSTHDGNHHLSRTFDAVKTIREGHFPLRWAGTLNYNCGVPVFNFFYPLIYYLAIIVNAFGPDVITSLKLIDFASFFVGTFFFYLWIKTETKNKWIALSSSIVYLYAPYRFLLVFVRGSPEFIAYAVVPIVLYLFALVFEAKDTRRFMLFSFLAALAGGFLTISHNFTVMFLMPLILLYILIKIFKNKIGFTRILVVLFSFLSAFGLGAFFIFPAILEEKFTQIGTARFLYSDHFPSLQQLIRSKWDYFYSAIGTELDAMSFQLGYAHWVIVILVILWLGILLINMTRKGKLNIKFLLDNIWIIIFALISVVSIYLMLGISNLVWLKLPILQKIQFPWRILGISVLTISSLFAFWVTRIKNKLLFWILIIGIPFLAFLGNRNHLLPQPVMDKEAPLFENFEKLHYHRYSTTTFADDILAKTAATFCWFDTPLITTDKEEIKYSVIERGSTFGKISFLVPENYKGQKLVMGLGYYPNAYEININGGKIEYFDCEGRICIDITQAKTGLNFVDWRVVQTPIQMFFNLVTVGFLVIWFVILFLVYFRPKITKTRLLLIAVFILFVFFRFYNLEKRVAFGWDQERDVNAVMQILSGDVKLIGPRVLSDTGFFLPPYFFYFLVPFYKLFNGSPYAMIGFLFFYNTLFFATSIFVLSKIFNRKIAIIFAMLWAISPIAISADVVAWNPLIIPLIVMFIIYTLFQNQNFGKIKTFLLGLLWGIGVAMHIQILLLTPIIIPLISKIKKYAAFILLGFVITFIPLVIFDLANNFINFKLMTGFFGNLTSKDYFAFLDVWDIFTARFFGIPVSRLASLGFYLFVLALLWLFMTKFKEVDSRTKSERQENFVKGCFYVWLTFPIFFAIYGKRPSEYYFNYLVPLILLVFALIIARLKTRLLYLVVALVLIYYIVYDKQFLKDGVFGLYKKDKVAQFLSQITKNTSAFNVSYSIESEGDPGFRYLLKWRGVNYSDNKNDPLIQISAPPTKSSTFIVNSIGIELPKDWAKENLSADEN